MSLKVMLFNIVYILTFYFSWIYSQELSALTACGENEMNVQCLNGFCGPKTCEDLGYPKPCSGSTVACHAGCVCIDGYVRDKENKCIPMSDCPGCGGDTNATSGCGNYCGNTCSDYMEVNKTCLSGCRYNSCACKNGYVHSEKISKCILPIDCETENKS